MGKLSIVNFFKDRKRVIYDRDGGDPYLVRYYLFLKDRKDFPFNLTLHKVLVSDEPVLHDHPWNWGALLLKVDIGNTLQMVSFGEVLAILDLEMQKMCIG